MGRRNSDDIDDDSGGQDEGLSKSARKRAATAAQELGERLIELSDADLSKLSLPELLVDAIRAARNIRSFGGLARQRQYIGRLMREIDPAPVLQLLDARSHAHEQDAERFRRVEAWRDRLVAEGDAALTALSEWRQLSPAQHAKLTDTLERARRTTSSDAQRAAAARELFRMLRTLFNTDPSKN